MLHSLDENGGRMAVVLPHGVLFRGASEGKIRKEIIEFNLLDAVIGLPANLFYGTAYLPAFLFLRKTAVNPMCFSLMQAVTAISRKARTRTFSVTAI